MAIAQKFQILVRSDSPGARLPETTINGAYDVLFEKLKALRAAGLFVESPIEVDIDFFAHCFPSGYSGRTARAAANQTRTAAAQGGSPGTETSLGLVARDRLVLDADRFQGSPSSGPVPFVNPVDSSSRPGCAAYRCTTLQRPATHFYSSRRDRRPPRVSETFFRVPYSVGLRGSPDVHHTVFGELPPDEPNLVRCIVHLWFYDRPHSRIFVLGNGDYSEHERVRGFECAGTGRKQHDYRFSPGINYRNGYRNSNREADLAVATPAIVA